MPNASGTWNHGAVSGLVALDADAEGGGPGVVRVRLLRAIDEDVEVVAERAELDLEVAGALRRVGDEEQLDAVLLVESMRS